MNRIGTSAAFIALLGALWGGTHNPGATGQKPVRSEVRTSAEMQKLADAFDGVWNVTETFEVSASQQGKTRRGIASFRLGPGVSLIEDYQSNGSAGELKFFALLWWDQSVRVYRLLTCANNDGCRLRGTAKWEGQEFVNSWEENVDGETVNLKDSFVDISPSSFRLISEGTEDGKKVWRVITKYERKEKGKP